MALSDLILRLGSQAKDLENSASALHAENDAKLRARASELHTSLSRVKVAFEQNLQADSDAAASQLTGLQRTIADGFGALRDEAVARTADVTLEADTAARLAELDAEDAIDLAVYALQEAEYYVLGAVAAQRKADDRADARPDAEIDGETAVEDTVVTDGYSVVEAVETIDVENPAPADEEPKK